MKELIGKLGNLQAETVIITDPGNSEASGSTQRLIRLLKPIPELFTPIPYIVPAQLFAASLAAEKGLDPPVLWTLP
jgi:glucosamine--fructose-6-phosphate aminotransferase (isomerizing)